MTAPTQTIKGGARAAQGLAAMADAQHAVAPGGDLHLPAVVLAHPGPLRELISTGTGDHPDGLVGGAAEPVPGRPVDAGQLPAGDRFAGHGQRLHQQHDRDRALDADPDHHRRVRRVRFRMDQVSRPRHPLRDRRRPARGAHPDDAHPRSAALFGAGPERHIPGHLAGAYRLRTAAGDIPALQLHLPAATRPVRVGGDRRRIAFPGLHPDRGAAVHSGHRRIRHLPVPVGLERPAGRIGLPGRQRRPARAAHCARPADRQSRRRRGTS